MHRFGPGTVALLLFAFLIPGDAPSAPLTDPDDPRTWQGASVETFRVLLGFPTRQALIDAQILDDDVFPTEHLGYDLADFAANPVAPCPAEALTAPTGIYIGDVQGCSGYSYDPNSYAYNCSTESLADFTARGSCLDWHWVQDFGVNDVLTATIWDTGGQSNQVAVFPIIDHGPLPQEAIEYSVYLSNDPNATTIGTDGDTEWVFAELVKVYLEGWHPGWIADGFATVYQLPGGQTFRYTAVPAGGPGGLISDGDHEIDAIMGLTEEGNPVGDEGDDDEDEDGDDEGDDDENGDAGDDEGSDDDEYGDAGGFAPERAWHDADPSMSDLLADDDLSTDDNDLADFRAGTAFRGGDGARGGPGRHRSTDDLLTALGQEHRIDVRLQIVRRLVGAVDVSLNALLIEHLEAIRAEAISVGNDQLANQALALMKRLRVSEN